MNAKPASGDFLPLNPPLPVHRRVSKGAFARHSRMVLVRRLLVCADVIGLTLAFLVASVLVNTPASELLREVGIFVLTTPLWVLIAKLQDLYNRDDRLIEVSTVDDLGPVFHLLTLGAWLGTVALFVASELQRGRVIRGIWFWALGIVFVVFARAAARAIARRRNAYRQNTVIVGAGEVGQRVARNLLRHREYGLDVVGFIDAAPKSRDNDLVHLALLGGPDDILAIVEEHRIDRAIIAFSNDDHQDILETARRLRDIEVHVDVVPRLFDVINAEAQVHSAEGIPLVGLPGVHLPRSARQLKRALDITVSAAALVVLAPFFAVIAACVKLDSPGPALFLQTRAGQDGRPFRVFKFRTMVRNADLLRAEVMHLNLHAQGTGDTRMLKIENDPRITRAGRILRSTFIDELPQLINVLRGDMSLIGPRPLVLEEARHIEGWGARRLDLKPGITGLWQVLGSSDISFGEMVQLDYIYVTSWSLWNDIRLLLRTIPLVLSRQGR